MSTTWSIEDRPCPVCGTVCEMTCWTYNRKPFPKAYNWGCKTCSKHYHQDYDGEITYPTELLLDNS